MRWREANFCRFERQIVPNGTNRYGVLFCPVPVFGTLPSLVKAPSTMEPGTSLRSNCWSASSTSPEDMMNNRLTISLVAASLLASSAALAQSTTATGAVNGARAGGEVAGPVGEVVGGTVGAAVGAGLEIPNAVITSIQGERVPSVTVRERVVVGEPLPPTVELRPVPRYSDDRYAVVNDRRVIVEPRTRKIIKIID